MDNKAYYSVLNDLITQNTCFWQVTIVSSEGSTPAKSGMKMLIPLESTIHGNLGGGEMEHIIIAHVRETRPEKPSYQTYILSEQGDSAGVEDSINTSMICGGKVSVFIEPLFSSKMLYIVGAGHCGQALAHLAGLCGYRAILIDNREEILATIPPEICSELHFNDYSDLGKHVIFSDQAHIVIMTHGHIHDQHVLEQCLGKPCRYLGMIGSTRKVAATLESLREKGYFKDDLAAVHAPVGLQIGSQTPYEIAVSILAQLIQINSVKTPK